MYDPIKDIGDNQDVAMREVSPDYDRNLTERQTHIVPRQPAPSSDYDASSVVDEDAAGSVDHDRQPVRRPYLERLTSSQTYDNDDTEDDGPEESRNGHEDEYGYEDASTLRGRTVANDDNDDNSSPISDVGTDILEHDQQYWQKTPMHTNGHANGHHHREQSSDSQDESMTDGTYDNDDDEEEVEWTSRHRSSKDVSRASQQRYDPVKSELATRTPRNDPMSISAMLSPSVEEQTTQPSVHTAPGLSAMPKTPKSRVRSTKKKVNGDGNVSAKRSRTQYEVEENRHRDYNKSRPSSTLALEMSDMSDSSEDPYASDEDQYSDLKDKFHDQWQQTCARLVAAEQLSHRRRGAETASKLLSIFDKRIRKTQKTLEDQHFRAAMVRATFEEGVRREHQKRELAAAKKRAARTTASAATAAAAATAMAPPTTAKKLSRKQRREQNAAEAQARARARSQMEAAIEEEATTGRTRKPEKIEANHDLIWKDIARKEIPKVYRIIQSNHANRGLNLKKTGQLCAKEARRWQFRTNKTAKDMQAKSKRAMREMLIFWKRNERGDLLNRQKAEREIIDRAKKEEEDREARRQSRKLNFLITQTELYSHFIGNKVKTAEAEQSEDTAGDSRFEPSNTHSPMPVPIKAPSAAGPNAEIDFDADDDEALQAAAARNAQEAVEKAKQKAQGFDAESGARKHQLTGDAQADANAMDLDFQNPTTIGDTSISQPKMLNATLKEYQLKGLNWLVNLYEQGINGILADEMGLGKTVQSISVMAHLAETYNIWGPFLVIAPASTLHNWQQEITKFVPRLKALPYWGNTKDRKVLRKFWDRKRATYTEDAPFHVVITSYQLVVQDSQYFQNVKWQYMILDEAQAIKSSQSTRWKNLLGFKCRNRLLLTGTPIQNTMQELWALLHFIMPSLFDSHNEFSEWFSKDIENHAQKNSELNEEQLKRLHMILKPFMLRRVKKNVQKELGDKIELDVFCDLNMRQRALYSFLRREISMKDILEKATSDRDSDLSSLMNLVMQLRKVCNHPDLFERADVRAPLALVDMPRTANLAKEGREIGLNYASTSAIKYTIPKFIYRSGGMLDVPSATSTVGSRRHCLQNLMNVYAPANVHESSRSPGGAFAWTRHAGMSPTDVLAAYRDSLADWLLHSDATSDDYLHISKKSFLLSPSDKRRNLTASSRDGPMSSLLTVYKTVSRETGLHRIEPMYDPAAVSPPIEVHCADRSFVMERDEMAFSKTTRRILYGLNLPEESALVRKNLFPDPLIKPSGMLPALGQEKRGYNNIRMPSMQTFITDSGKLSKLDELLSELKKNDHRVLLYFQMTKMIDLMEEYLVYRQYKYLRLDGSSKISDRRDMVNDWQTRPEIFVFLLSTRAGGLGINLTAADTVIFYDSDWNPTIDSQAMDRAHRLGQTKQVTVYRLITRGSIEERILSRAKEKEEVQKVVISGGDYKQGTTDNIQFQAQKGGGRDVVSWLLEDDDQVRKVSKQLDSLPTRTKKGSKARQGPSLDDLYHEGENKMESEHHSPEPDMETDEPAKKKKKVGTKKKPRIQEL